MFGLVGWSIAIPILLGIACGIWIDRMFGNDYATAMALIILQIPNNYLPILQK